MRCWDCGLPDPYDGNGDSIGSCDCPRCEWCGGPPLQCSCNPDDNDHIEGWAEPGDETW